VYKGLLQGRRPSTNINKHRPRYTQSGKANTGVGYKGVQVGQCEQVVFGRSMSGPAPHHGSSSWARLYATAV